MSLLSNDPRAVVERCAQFRQTSGDLVVQAIETIATAKDAIARSRAMVNKIRALTARGEKTLELNNARRNRIAE